MFIFIIWNWQLGYLFCFIFFAGNINKLSSSSLNKLCSFKFETETLRWWILGCFLRSPFCPGWFIAFSFTSCIWAQRNNYTNQSKSSAFTSCTGPGKRSWCTSSFWFNLCSWQKGCIAWHLFIYCLQLFMLVKSLEYRFTKQLCFPCFTSFGS